jgi:hypothetical protein
VCYVTHILKRNLNKTWETKLLAQFGSLCYWRGGAVAGTTTESFWFVVCLRRVASRLQLCIGLWRGTFFGYVKVCTFTGRLMSNAICQTLRTLFQVKVCTCKGCRTIDAICQALRVIFYGATVLVVQGLIIEASISHSVTPHSVGLLWTSDQPAAETSTWQH